MITIFLSKLHFLMLRNLAEHVEVCEGIYQRGSIGFAVELVKMRTSLNSVFLKQIRVSKMMVRLSGLFANKGTGGISRILAERDRLCKKIGVLSNLTN
ncbi:hypothetical protein D3Z48_15040 [Clostridiaceae bacterium]|nr:hypothetical protein [Clostridiaceae bacterium]